MNANCNRFAQTASELEHVFQQVFGSTLGRGERFAPNAEIREYEGEFRITLELPGVKLEDIHVEFSDDQLRISGEKKTECEDAAKACHCSERRGGSFQRAFRFTTDVDPEKIDARLENGLLLITLPKAATVLPRKIEIRATN